VDSHRASRERSRNALGFHLIIEPAFSPAYSRRKVFLSFFLSFFLSERASLAYSTTKGRYRAYYRHRLTTTTIIVTIIGSIHRPLLALVSRETQTNARLPLSLSRSRDAAETPETPRKPRRSEPSSSSSRDERARKRTRDRSISSSPLASFARSRVSASMHIFFISAPFSTRSRTRRVISLKQRDIERPGTLRFTFRAEFARTNVENALSMSIGRYACNFARTDRNVADSNEYPLVIAKP